MDRMKVEDLPMLFESVKVEFEKEKDELCRMDAELGDGDLGLTMSKGFSALPGLLKENMVAGDVGQTLVKSGMKMAAVVPSTMGTLMSSGIMGAGMALKGKDSIDGEGLVTFLSAFASALQRRGKAKAGDRTILDAAFASEEKAKAALDEGQDLAGVAKAAYEGGLEGVEKTKDMKPVFGKAAVFEEKAIGKPDQGAYAYTVLLRGLLGYISK